MTVERETAGYAVPFAAGVLPGAYYGHNPYGYDIAAFMSLISVSLCIFVLASACRRRMSRPTTVMFIVMAAFSTGILCGITASQTEVSYVKGSLSLWAEGFGLRMQTSIDRIPFRNPDCNAISKALITGEKSDIPKEITESFRQSGASHILALSGLHLGIIYAIMIRILSCLGNRPKTRIHKSLVIITICGFYTLATGAGPSIVRAFLFILLAESARLFHRYHSTGQLLFSALIIQLTISPLSIRSVGFQLSYAAMAGIAFILPHLKSYWPGDIREDRAAVRAGRKIWHAAAMSVSCQITTAPLAWYHFGTFPMHFLLTNLMAIPLTGIIIPAILVTLILNCLEICPHVVVKTTEALIMTLTRALDIISSM